MTKPPVRIGLSACFLHPDPKRNVFGVKTLLYMEQSLATKVMEADALPVLIPPAAPSMSLRHILKEVDGVIFQGGDDVSPSSYGESPIRPEWEGDPIRDQYEIALYREALEAKKPVLGICRGLQLINVAEGGTLFQDIATQKEGAQTHRDRAKYDAFEHEIRFEKDALLRQLYKGSDGGKVNSVHHQAVFRLAPSLKAEAQSVPDGIVEAVRRPGSPFVLAVQWHPEFETGAFQGRLASSPIFSAFMDAVRKAGN